MRVACEQRMFVEAGPSQAPGGDAARCHTAHLEAGLPRKVPSPVGVDVAVVVKHVDELEVVTLAWGAGRKEEGVISKKSAKGTTALAALFCRTATRHMRRCSK